MLAIVYEGFGSVSVIQQREVPAPALKAGQIRLRVGASGLNRADLVQRKGNYPPPPGESEIPGLEVAGTVTEVAPGVKSWKEGDRAMALLAGGGYAQEVTVDAGLALPMPKGWSFPQGAATVEAFVTAYLNLFLLGGVQKGETALVHAGASGVGTAAIQLLRAKGARALVTVGSPDKAAFCEKLGAEAIIYKAEDFEEAVSAKTLGQGVQVILDPVGGRYLEPNLRCLALEGRLVVIGTMGGREGKLDVGRLLGKRLRVLGSTLRVLPLDRKREIVQTFWKDCEARFTDETLKPIVDKVFPATAAIAAQERMEANLNVGKIILAW